MENSPLSPRPTYHCHRGIGRPDLEWHGAYWRDHAPLTIGNFHPRGSSHKPETMAKLAYDDTHIHVLFSVQDQFVRSTRTTYQESVWKDSCVEFFVQPIEGRPYINFEMNCGGTLLLMHNTPLINDVPSQQRDLLPQALAADVRVESTAPRVVDPELTSPYAWRLLLSAPLSLFEHYFGSLRPLAGTTWRANLYKCADESSHPHWGSWSPIEGELSFHRARCFGYLKFDGLGRHPEVLRRI